MNAVPASLTREVHLLDRLAAPILLARGDGQVLHANPAARELLGRELGVTPQQWEEDAAPKVAFPPMRLAELKNAAPEAVVRMLVGVSCCGGGRLTTLDVRVSRAHGDGALLIEGVTENAARLEIQRLTEQLVALSFGYPDMRIEVAKDGTILDFVVSNPAELALRPELLLEQRIEQAIPAPAGPMLSETVRRFAAGEACDSAAFSLCGPGGEQFFEARLIKLGEVDRIFVTIRNVTDRVKAEREAAVTRDRLVEALESISDGFVLYDADDRLVLANSRYRQMFDGGTDIIAPGARFEDVLRHTALNSIYGINPGELETWLERRLELHRVGGDSVEAQLTDGRWLRVEERVTKSGDRVGLRSDITELKRREADLHAAREAAEVASQQKTGFVHHLSHELRTPLNAVLGFAQMIADELLGPAGNARYPLYAAQIAEAGSYMLELINNLLDLAKIEAGRLQLDEEVCDLHLIVDLILSMVSGRARQAKVTVVNLLPAQLPSFVADPSLTRQMLTNLIGNAIKFCRNDGGGRVEVGVNVTDDGGLDVFVRDNGPGMSPEQIPMALSPFEQAHDRKLAPEVGTGLGLPLTRALIELHGGRFVIESALGVGTTVRLIFPASRVSPQTPEA